MNGNVTPVPSAGKPEFGFTAMPDFTAMPQELKELHQWALFKLEGDEKKPQKVPYRPNGKHAMSNVPATWSSFEKVVAAYEAGGYDGLCFALSEEDPYCVIDLDDSRDPVTGELTPLAQGIIASLKTYAEVSPSGTGAHLIGRAELPAACNVDGIEMYDRVRFITMTGWHLDGTPSTIEDIQEAAVKLWEEVKAEQGGSGKTVDIPEDAIDWSADPESIREQLEKIIASDPQLRRTWEHERPDLKDTFPSAYDLSLCSQLARKYGWTDPTRLYLVIRLHRAEHGDPDKKSKRKDYICRTIGKALASLEDDDEDDGGLDVIKLRPGYQSRVVKKAAALLARKTLADPYNGFYQRDGVIVQITPSTGGPELGGGSSLPRLVVTKATPEAVLLTLGELARWEGYDKRSNGWGRKDPPPWVAQMLLKYQGAWGDIPHLAGIVEAPSLRPGGTVLQQPGYDPLTGLLFDPGDVEFPLIPEAPTQEEGIAALKELTDLLVDFPFADEASLSVALSAIITPLVRPACDAVPLHAITAPVMGSGKTELAKTVSYIALGREPFTTGQAKDAAEEEKRLLALVLECHSIVIFDNLDRELRSAALCRVLTGEVFADRVLGVTATAQGRSAATFYATGNNLVIAGDLTTRALLCALDPKCEHPLQRTFVFKDLKAEVLKRRPELVVAALTVVLSYLTAGEPDQKVVNLTRFKHWCRFVRNTLIWLGMADPYDSRTRLESLDPVREQLGALQVSWFAMFGSEAVKVGDAIKAAEPTPYTKVGSTEDADRKALYEILAEINGHGSISPARIGKFLSSHDGRIQGGLRFERATKAQGAIRWRVIEVETKASSTGEAVNAAHKNGGNGADHHGHTVTYPTPGGKIKLVIKKKSNGQPSPKDEAQPPAGSNGAPPPVDL
jgi:hypothetical protein